MNYDKLQIDHYRKVARHNLLASTCTMEDPFVRKSEVDFILYACGKYISEKRGKKKTIRILDLGCGNGYTLKQISINFPGAELFGMEFSPELYDLAFIRELPRCHIYKNDCRSPLFWQHPEIAKQKFDIIITERVLINLMQREQQLLAVEYIADALCEDGMYILSESFEEGLHELNVLRKEVLLEPIEESKQNLYINQEVLSHIERQGLLREDGIYRKNFLSAHFFSTRVLQKIIRPPGGSVKNTLLADYLTKGMPSDVGGCAVIRFHIYRKLS